ncbi:hypothetical protein QLX08_003671 [Tetragonisca angustula]|uniref:Uncharacterized protein n=1 Tax=Tetragonisca angustula TaxID=166442 RepID=A0AAW1A616_9HYME
MTNSCEFFPTEYTRNYRKKKIQPAVIVYHKDYFTDRIEEGEIDPRIASIPTQLDETAEQLVHKHIFNRLRTVYQVSYVHRWIPRDGKQVEEIKEKDHLQSELITYIRNLYFNPHGEKVLAPPVTAKRSKLTLLMT